MADDSQGKRLQQLQYQSQATLIQFLNAGLDLAFTMIQTARTKADIHPEQFPNVTSKVSTALRTVRLFVGRIQDGTTRAKIQSRSNELEDMIAELSRQTSN